MNEYIYYTLIIPFIDKKDRMILKRRDRHLRIFKNKKQNLINAHIYMHLGSPCNRYCICHYFNKEEKLAIYLGTLKQSRFDPFDLLGIFQGSGNWNLVGFVTSC